MKKDGFGHFVGIDGSKVMLEEAQKKGVYQDLKQCLLGEKPLPVQRGNVIMSNPAVHVLLLYILQKQQIELLCLM